MSELRVYSKERVAMMSEAEKEWAIDMVKTSNSLTPQEKEENLKILQHNREAQIHAKIMEEAADIDDIGD